MHAYAQTLPTIHLHEMQRCTNVHVHLSVCTFIYSVEITRLLHPGLSLSCLSHFMFYVLSSATRTFVSGSYIFSRLLNPKVHIK